MGLSFVLLPTKRSALKGKEARSNPTPKRHTHTNSIPELCSCSTVVLSRLNVSASLRAFKNYLKECFVELKLRLQGGGGSVNF